ncbi:stage V sporulation protein D (Sporulation-specific penicillin binding protein) [Mycoplasma sp. CAG:776]|nr:stage V sporulation protein D (Sporulation-specific penicillin binding protein) [Mycoplasma sp. CAG:776]
MFFSNVHERIRFVFIISIIILIAIIIKVFYIQVFAYDKLSNLAESLWSRELPIKADRGLIIDRNGEVLATNITTVSLVVVPGQINDAEAVAKDLSDILNTDYQDMLKHVTKSTSIERVHPEGRGLDFEIAEKIDALGYDGVYLLKESKRYYPYESVLSHVLGYVGIDNQGLSGLELYYDDYLTGADGAIKYFSDGKGNKLELTEVYEAPTSGITLQLTIDLDLQLAIENELDNAISKYDPEQAMIVAMDPDTGEVLAMASRPNFDSNHYQEYSTEIINRNLPIWMTYEPGSTFKIITLSAALEEQTINLFEDTFTDTGAINVDGATIHCWKSGGHGTQTMLEVVENSCNPGFVRIGETLGVDTLMSYIDAYGFGNKTGIDLNGESSGILFDASKMGPVELATTSFGQGISVTPIQQVRAVSAAINGGKLYTPYIVGSFLESETNSLIEKIEPVVVGEVISEETSSLVRYALESVVANGSGKNAYIENYRVGGKTGTAQKVENGSYLDGNYILSFMGFLPADDPEIVVYVAIDNPKGVTQYGGVVSAPIARNVMLSAIDILDIEPSKEGMAKEYTWLDKKYSILPNVVGMSKEEATKTLKNYKIEYSGSGDTVIYQSPKEGYYVAEGETIMLLLG